MDILDCYGKRRGTSIVTSTTRQAEMTVDLLLSGEVRRQILNESSFLTSSTLNESQWEIKPRILDTFNYISETSFKSIILAKFLKHPPFDMTSDMQESGEICLCFTLALSTFWTSNGKGSSPLLLTCLKWKMNI